MAYSAIMGNSIPVVEVLDALKEFTQQHLETSHLLTDTQDSPAKYPKYQVKGGLILFRNLLFIPTGSALPHLVIEEYHSSPSG